jgi:L-alanine-DL-glutamate epimerase-like enolase superfamily enzyme
MRVTDVRLTPIRVTCRDVPPASHWGGVEREHVIVRVTADDTVVGWGEISGLGPSTPLGPDLARLEAALTRDLSGVDPRRLGPLARRLQARLGDGPTARAVRCGMDLALHDLVGRASGLPVSGLLSGAERDTVRVAYAIGAHRRVEDVAASLAYVGERLARGFDLLRAYIGLNRAADDQFLAGLQQAFGHRVRIKTLDCNGHLDARAALRALDRYHDHDILLVESPARRGDLAGLAEVRRHSPFPIAEHCDSPAEALALARHGAVDVVNVRCLTAGGLLAARAVATVAEAAGLGCVLGAAHELNLGTAAQVHLGASLARHDYPADCIGPETYTADVTADLLHYAGSTLHVPTAPGLGFPVDEILLAHHALADESLG